MGPFTQASQQTSTRGPLTYTSQQASTMGPLTQASHQTSTMGPYSSITANVNHGYLSFHCIRPELRTVASHFSTTMFVNIVACQQPRTKPQTPPSPRPPNPIGSHDIPIWKTSRAWARLFLLSLLTISLRTFRIKNFLINYEAGSMDS
ncbi:hypothetical protein CDAR_545071 [Caerostris darwini]|uniref:Uncharacterized protein n=1 Tax=Caerostris darwini TaxID=1538125 RepID=A0AAV4TKE4_9ARAC|nr:hypothetical protein CDAR_545071 [Caerostris darwini]